MPRVADLKQDRRNARRHTDRNREQIASSIARDGFGRSLLLAADDTIIAGNATAQAAESAGLDDVLVVETDGTKIIAVKRTDIAPDSPEFRRLALADNRSAELAEWDADVLRALSEEMDFSSFWHDEELAALLDRLDAPSLALTDPDAVPEPPAEPITKPGDLWLLGRHRLLCGDSTFLADVERLMAGERADMVWTDPPYGVAIGDKNKFLNSIARSNRIEKDLTNDTLDEESLHRLLWDAFTLAASACTAGAAWYVAAPAGPLHLRFGEVLRDLGIYRQTLIWVKNNATFAPLGVSYRWAHEPIFYGWMPNGAHAWHGDRKQTTVWQIDRPQASPDHPTMKPVELVAQALQHSSLPNALVIDPFLGSGTTLIAAEQLGRRCFGMEIDPIYCDVIVRRWEEFTGQTAKRETAVT